MRGIRNLLLTPVISGCLLCWSAASCSQEPAVDVDLQRDLVAWWPLQGDLQERSGRNLPTVLHGTVDPQAAGRDGVPGHAAGFDGRSGWLEVPAERLGTLGSDNFSLSLWLQVDPQLDDVPGDLLSQYDPATRRGFQLSLKTNAVTTSLANDRHLTFSIDNARTTDWMDCGRPGRALLAFALAVHDDALYAGTCEPGADETGHVYRYQPPTAGEAGTETRAGEWIDCGAPDRSNSVTALAVHDGHLYAGTGKYRVAGSALQESENQTLGGRVFRYAGGDRWEDCGQLPGTEAIGGLIVFRDQLYASSLYKPAGFYRYDGQGRWTDCGTPDGRRVVALGVYNGFVYATSYDGGRVYRYDGATWTDCGQLGDNTQTYSFAVLQGRLYVGTWPSGRVYRFEDVDRWTDVGRLGEELEVMGMLVHNGQLLAGTLPLAEVYGFDGHSAWTKLTRLDHTPDVRYRRAWTMAEYRGRLFCSTLPSGHIYAFEAGRNVASGRTLTPGWHHVAAVRGDKQLQLFVDGRLVGTSAELAAADYDLTNTAPLKIGFGQNDYFRGRLSDVRVYRRSLNPAEVQRLAQQH